MLTAIPLGRLGYAETDIGRAAVYLASDDAAYITGTTLMVDGGFNYLRRLAPPWRRRRRTRQCWR